VRWTLGGLEVRSIRRTYAVLDGALREAGLGRLEVPLDGDAAWRDACESGKHHNMGTTRMHASPSLGVVDADARVHGVANLHVAGSSVFPTFGYANPTLTIVALAVRLGRHLAARLAG
jgi:choline dehydrogenase-like flavoprotein